MPWLEEYFPAALSESRMACEGDVATARRLYLEAATTNLRYLLRKRLRWMNDYIPAQASLVVELGCGIGITREFISSPALVLTDNVANPWVDRKVDALDMPFAPGSVDVLIANNMIHHLAYPVRFFAEAARVLKPGGRLLIQDIEASWLMRLILRLMRHDGFSLRQDPFDLSRPCNDPHDLWSANCAIPQLLFGDPGRFQAACPDFEVEEQGLSEFLIFLLSGGVTAKTRTLPLPLWALRGIDRLDGLLVRLAPGLFASQRRVVLRKRPA